jgi:hypothetical protein
MKLNVIITEAHHLLTQYKIVFRFLLPRLNPQQAQESRNARGGLARKPAGKRPLEIP